ncbi:MAG TPA: hypothetical protein DDW73_24605 [Rhizobium sp.]|jgi:D-serine deaminase-like pyridoxal phosphate-dependent protein|nr:hypothetical protein [Rhizobium sp.]
MCKTAKVKFLNSPWAEDQRNMDEPQSAWENLSTLAAFIDLDIVERNIQRFQDYAGHHGLNVRPHIKIHTLPAVPLM